MNKKLFDIRTTVAAEIEFNVALDKIRLNVVRINAPKDVRSRIWGIVTNTHFNPGVARYEGQTPTTMTLEPYPGYEDSDLVAQMAEAAACFALVEDFTILFDKNVFAVLDGNIAPWYKGFGIDSEVVVEFQRRYVSYMAVKSLRSQLHDLGLAGLNYGAIKEWYDEAVEAFRRLQFTSNVIDDKTHLLDIAVQNLQWITKVESAARLLRQTQADIRQDLERGIDDFATTIMASGPTKQQHHLFTEISILLEIERNRLKKDVNGFTQSWITIQTAMDQIRKVTPPEPLTPKK